MAPIHFQDPDGLRSPPLVQCRADEMRKRLGLNVAFLLDGIHIHPKPKPFPAAKRVSASRCELRVARCALHRQGTRVLTGSGRRSQGPPCQGTRALLRGIPSSGRGRGTGGRVSDRCGVWYSIGRGGAGRTFSKLVAIVSAWLPRRRSEAIATQRLPTMATTLPPLYSIIDCARARAIAITIAMPSVSRCSTVGMTMWYAP
jgi:hypothetical protein